MTISIDELRNLLSMEEPDYRAAKALGTEVLPYLAQFVSSPDPALASKAASLAAMFDDPRAGDVLRRAAQSTNPVVRVAAAASVGHRSVPADVVETLQEDVDVGVRRVARQHSQQANGSSHLVNGTAEVDLAESPRRGRTPTRTITFEPEPITVPITQVAGRGESAGEREVEAEINSLGRYIGAFWDNYHAGLNNFETGMSFASDQEARPRHFEVMLKEVAKILLDKLIADAFEEFPVLGQVVKAVKTIATAWKEESERAARAQGERRIADYIAELRNQAGSANGPQQRMLRALDEERPRLLAQYREAVRRTGITRQGQFGVLTGDAAMFLRSLRGATQRFRSALPSPAHFAQLFAEKFGGSTARTYYISQGGRIGGTLYLTANLYYDAPNWTLRSVSSEWTLATTAPRPDRIATVLKGALRQLGKNIWQTNLPKMVQLRVEEEVSGLNRYLDGYIRFIHDPARFEVRSNYGLELFRRAWMVPGIRQRILQVSDLEGSNR